MKMRDVVTFARLGAVMFLVAVPLSSRAANEPEDIIKYRQHVMKANGEHMAAMAAIIQGKVEYRSELAVHARAIQETVKDIPSLFPKGSDFGETKALDEVWTKRAEFDKRAKNSKIAADALVKAVASGDNKLIAAKFKDLSEDCKACHKDFRKEEE